LAQAKGAPILVVVKDAQGNPVKGIKIGIDGPGDSQSTGPDGKAVLTLEIDARQSVWVSFEIVNSPPGEDFVIVAPADHGQHVSWADKDGNVVHVMVIPRRVFMTLVAKPRMREVTRRIPPAPPKP
jgi:hypothetical protein